MNAFMQMLAQNNTPVTPAPTDQTIPASFFGHLPVEDIWQFVNNVSWVHAVGFIAFGTIYLVYGWRVFKALVIINCAALGLFLGVHVGTRLGSSLWGGIMGTILAGIISWPFMKYSVAVLGGIAGAVLGGALWRVSALPEPLIWCGALVGLISGGFLAFSSFKVSVMLFTSLQGSTLVVIGALALLSDYPNLHESLTNVVYNKVFFLPILLIIPTIFGVFFQQWLLKNEAEWAMPE
jgi:hypothetical protein